MLQEKFVGYLENRDANKEKRCVGYVRVEVFEDTCDFEICVQKMHETDSFTRDIVMHGVDSNGYPIEGIMGQIQLNKGQAVAWFRKLNRENLASSGITWESIKEIQISIGSGSVIVCEIHKNIQETMIIRANEIKLEKQREDWQTREMELEAAEILERKNDSLEENSTIGDMGSNDLLREADPEAPKENSDEQTQIVGMRVEKEEKSPQKETGREEQANKTVYKWNPQEVQNLGKSRMGTRDDNEQIQIPRMQEEKWAQLSGIYPKVNPFKDKRTYLKLGIQDFVILPEKYYTMCKNSFLLHGYMNYGYLVLGTFIKRGNYEYYLGVPGVFYEKERQVAKLYGFDYFEADRELARDGDFGIYLMKIAL